MKEFQAVFQISKTVIFEVRYYTLSTNTHADFATTAAEFCRSKRDFRRCGQAQRDLLPPRSAAGKFFEKWDPLHLRELTPEQYAEMIEDMEKLKYRYNFIFEELDESRRPYSPRFSFYRLVEFSKQTPKYIH